VPKSPSNARPARRHRLYWVGAAYLAAIVATLLIPDAPTAARWWAVLPGVGGLLALRRLGQETGGGLLKSGKSNEFHRGTVRQWRNVSRGGRGGDGTPASGGPTVCEGRGVALREERRVMDCRVAFGSSQ
jgi:hypothetical protein